VLAGSKTDPLLANAKPTSDGSSTSVITYLRKGSKKLQKKGSEESKVRRHERNNSADTRPMKKEGGRGAQDTGAESLPLQLVMKIMVRQVHGGPRWSRYPPVAHGRDPTPEQVNS